MLILSFAIGLFAQDIRSGTEKLDQGIKNYQEDKLEESKAGFTEALNIFNTIKEGVQTPEDVAYTQYYIATCQYYIARIDKDSDGFSKASDAFQDAINAFKTIETLGEEYVRSLYYRSLCSFRQYQIATTENVQLKTLDNAVGDLS